MTDTYLKNYAINNVWCSPTQDNQIKLSSGRIVKPGGAIGSIVVMGRVIPLPTPSEHYQVYQIGQVPPVVLGLLPNTPIWARSGWVNFADVVNQTDLYCDLYTTLGIHTPLHQAYYRYTGDQALIFCVRMDNRLPVDFATEQVHLRLYTNAFYGSDEADSITNTTRTNGGVIQTSADIQRFAGEVTIFRQQSGEVFCFKNGELVSAFSLITVAIGDLVEYVYDPSVRRKVSFLVRDLPSFTSTRDQCYKYLLHYLDQGDGVIDYVDDIDVYIRDTDPYYIGRYYHQNRQYSMRNITHRDFSISVDQYRSIAESLAERLSGGLADDLQAYTVDIYIRRSGLTRPLVSDNYRLFELYKMQDSDIMAVLTGDETGMPYWNAVFLENCDFNKLFGTPYREITDNMIEEALGYNAICRILADTPQTGSAIGNVRSFRLPVGLIEYSTVYEYSEAGDLLGVHRSSLTDLYIATHVDCRIIEVISGHGQEVATTLIGTNNIALPTKYSYRVYFCYLNEYGQPNGDWKDITGDDTYYTVVNNALVWQSGDTSYILHVRTDQHFLSREYSILPVAGTLYFDITEIVDGDEVLLDIPYGYVDIWLNGKSLIYGLSYFINGTRIYITDREHIVQPFTNTPQQITLRFYGLADKDENNKPVIRNYRDFGFIQHGVLSNDSEYDVRDDKILRITVRGQLRLRDQVTFSEHHLGIDQLNATNGSPYEIKPIIAATLNHTVQDTYTLLAKSQVIDAAVESYLTQKIPQPARNAISAIPNRYRIVSPFFAHIVNDLATGQFNYEDILNIMTDNDIMALCEIYLPLLKYDPINTDYSIDDRYVLITPHASEGAISIDRFSYRFFKQVVSLYGRGLVPISPYVVINLGS